MPQMLVIQPAASQAPPQAPSAGSPGNKEQSQFSPHLENAISSKRQQQQTAHDKGSKNKSPSTDGNTLIDANSQSQKPQQSEDKTDIFATATTQEQVDALKETSEQTYLALLNPESTLPIATNLPQNASAESCGEPNTSGKVLGLYTIQPELTELPPTITEPVGQNAMRPIAASGQDALISQLQQIIDNSNETGTVSITKAGNSFMPNSISSNIHGVTTASFSGNSAPIIVTTAPETAELNLNGLLVADVDGIERTVGKQMQQLTGIRHDSQQQYFNSKINTQNLAENNQNFQENQHGDELSQQSTSSSLQSSPLGAVEQTNTFSQISAIALETTTQPSNESAKPIILPSGTIVYEEEIIQQLTERFQISSKQMESRINLKLHPAELGELKIDLTVKEGSIRANIVAQSQHTLEILEKNIQKLKTVLENQGFTVDQISITAESDSVGDFDLFDRQLFSHNDDQPTAQKGRREGETAFALDANEYSTPAKSTGVNVKI